MISITMQTKQREKKKIKLWTVVFWIALWQAGSMALHSEILLASPLSVGRCLILLLGEGTFWRRIWFSFGRIASGFFAAAGLGILLSAAARRISLVKDLLALPVAALKATPVASFVVLVLIWLPSRNLSVLISFIMAFPIVYTNLLEGFENLDGKLLEMAQVFAMPVGKKLYYLYFAGLLPYFRSACAVAIGMSWKAGIAAELIGIPGGSIGESLYNAKIYLETPSLFAWTIVIITVSVLFEKGFCFCLKLAARGLGDV